MMSEVKPLIEKVWRHCEVTGNRGRTVTLKVKFADFELISRSRLASSEHASRSARRPTLTAPARDDVSEPRVGTKKRALRSNKETDEGQKICRSGELLVEIEQRN